MPYPGFPTGVENMGAVPPSPPLQNLMGQLESIHGASMERLKMLSKNTFEGVHLVAKLTATSLQLANLLKMNFFTHWKGTSHFNGGPSFFSVCEGGGGSGAGGAGHGRHQFWWGCFQCIQETYIYYFSHHHFFLLLVIAREDDDIQS